MSPKSMVTFHLKATCHSLRRVRSLGVASPSLDGTRKRMPWGRFLPFPVERKEGLVPWGRF
jgi:hypothetical protein